MSADWDTSDFARLLALEHAFSALALISASNYSFLAKISTSDAVAQFRLAIEGAVFDTRLTPPAMSSSVKAHLDQLFDHVAAMALRADSGPQ